MNTPNTKNYKEQILSFIRENYEVAPNEIIIKTGISQQTVHNNLKKLLNEGLILKKGSGLDVIYSENSQLRVINKPDLQNLIAEHAKVLGTISQNILGNIWNILYNETLKLHSNFSFEEFAQSVDFLAQNYFYISPDGNIFIGDQGLIEWADKLNPDLGFQEYAKMRLEYIDTMHKYNKYLSPNGLIDATNKFHLTFPDYDDIEKVFYCDFYAIERFGKTKLGNLMFYGKQSQNKFLIRQVLEIVKPRIIDFIKQNNINAVAFVPPTIARETQFMCEMLKFLDLNIPIIKMKKLVNQVAVPQKTIKNADDRILNAENIVVEMNPSYENVLILDDAVGSGSTFAVVARKLRKKKVALGKIFALAVVGSSNGVTDNAKKGYEVIGEV